MGIGGGLLITALIGCAAVIAFTAVELLVKNAAYAAPNASANVSSDA